MPIYVIDKIKQKNNGTFKLMDATDVVMKNGKNVETAINEIEIGVGDGIKTANDLLALLETDNTGRMIVDLNETGNKVEIHLDNTFVETLLTTSKLGQANGVASLDGNGMVPSTQLPSYVDDILEFTTKTSFPTTGETGKIYVARDTNLVYRWSGSAYVEISKSLALGETAETAYAGDKGAQNAKDISALRIGKQDKLIAGANIEIKGTTISSKLTPATANVIGGIKVGDGLKIDSTGLLSVNFATTEEIQAIFATTAINDFKIHAGASGLIDDTVFLTFQYEDGMTFEQFINSKYNVEQNDFSKIYSGNNVILLSYMNDSFWIATNEQERIKINEKINKDLNYFLISAGTNDNTGGGTGGK